MLPDSPDLGLRSAPAQRYLFRKGVPSDDAAVQEIFTAAGLSFVAPRTPDDFASDHFYVCEQAGEIAGALCCRFLGEEAEIFDVAVAKHLRRQGVGTFLLNGFKRAAKHRDVKHIFLEVRESNTAALSLYHKAGFCPTGVRLQYYRDPTEDAVLLRLTFPA